MTILYIDTFSGVAGDMLLAALIDAGAKLDDIKEQLSSISDIDGEWLEQLIPLELNVICPIVSLPLPLTFPL